MESIEGYNPSCQEFKQNNHHLPSLKMRLSNSLKAHIGYFQNQLTKVHNYSENASALAFISGLRVTHPLYKHLMKYTTCWSEVVYWAQPYIQLEEAMKISANQSFNRGDNRAKSKPQHKDPSVDN